MPPRGPALAALEAGRRRSPGGPNLPGPPAMGAKEPHAQRYVFMTYNKGFGSVCYFYARFFGNHTEGRAT